MKKGRNKEFIFAGIELLITKNYKLSKDLLDLNALIDKNLSFNENWDLIKPYILKISGFDEIRKYSIYESMAKNYYN